MGSRRYSSRATLTNVDAQMSREPTGNGFPPTFLDRHATQSPNENVTGTHQEWVPGDIPLGPREPMPLHKCHGNRLGTEFPPTFSVERDLIFVCECHGNPLGMGSRRKWRSLRLFDWRYNGDKYFPCGWPHMRFKTHVIPANKGYAIARQYVGPPPAVPSTLSKTTH